MVDSETVETQTRRAFLKSAALATGACAMPCVALSELATPELHEAKFYKKLGGKRVRCLLCPWRCTVQDGGRGMCGVRENRDGTYYSLVYGRPVALHNDPIEKKPFVHVYPGSRALSIATVGCNFTCKFCQNWEISQAKPGQLPAKFMSPSAIAKLAKAKGSKTIAYTYSEPVIFYEYMYDCAKAGKELGLGNVLISNGYIEKEPLKELLPLLTAVKVDFKSFREDYYRNVCGGELRPVLETLKTVKESGTWLEMVVLLVPTLNDSDEELTAMAQWIVKELGPEVPLNFIRFYPQYKLRNLPPTPQKTLQKAHDIAVAQGLNFVFATGAECTTRCPHCGENLIERAMEVTLRSYLKEGKCPKCGAEVPGVWN